MKKNKGKKSLLINSILSGGQKLLSIVFPLITFPYISRILLVDDIGKINFATSIISYFLLIAALGINNYATREGVKYRSDRKQISKFSSEIFSINIITTIIAYILLFICLLIFNKLQQYTSLILIQSITIVGTTIGINWLYSIHEDYLYITVRTLIMQFLSLVLMFLFVKNPNDYVIYTWITVFAACAMNIFNFIHASKYADVRLTTKLNLKKHIKPILVIFASSIAVTIYVNSDMTILGLICDDASVGYYSRSVRIYTIIKQMVASMVIVALPRLSQELNKKDSYEFLNNTKSIFTNILMLILPIGIGLACVAKYVMLIIAGEQYWEAIMPLRILGISSIFAVLSSFTTYCFLLPLKLEKIQMKVTYFAAAFNIISNIVVLPYLRQNGAAITTLISEAIVFIFEYIYILKKTNYGMGIKLKIKEYFKLMLGCIEIICIAIIVSKFSLSNSVSLILDILISSIVYFGTLYILNYGNSKSFVKTFIGKFVKKQ